MIVSRIDGLRGASCEIRADLPTGMIFFHVMARESLHTPILEIVSKIPRGRVATYGQVARLAGLSRQARLVGYALHALPRNTRVPWHRVVNSQGTISVRRGSEIRQRQLLEDEGIE